jgi:hypothetical protein
LSVVFCDELTGILPCSSQSIRFTDITTAANRAVNRIVVAQF